jgi:hypothetical protein
MIEQAAQTEINLFNTMAPGFALMFAFFMVSHLGDGRDSERHLTWHGGSWCAPAVGRPPWHGSPVLCHRRGPVQV